MDLTNKQKEIKMRREQVYSAYINKPLELATSVLVRALSKKHGVTEVQIYNDIKNQKKLN